ncbi:asparagine synthase (glutamine-hydrolyzing) [Streptomyces sp. EN23]|uniref:asparagine synthase (glutamine-hydrolyzing) n=1 Tax=Streptomyces sp. EN23 TaxID=212774 RepID=UPI000851DBDD|nr:asparagine synthase (glutamine-hydrolyzing) [Streptomyces sp. EN23]
MCGLAGLARIDGSDLRPDADGLLSRMADIISHRGPDDRELLRKGPVGLAFTRLSLVGPDDGAQPLVSADGDLVLIANGEVYNHQELASAFPAGTVRTSSDCEVLLPLYRKHGADFLDTVRGMFAVVIYDRRANQLVFARDRFGVKPLYYHRNAERIVFGSEIKALFSDGATPRRVDWKAALTHPMMTAAPHLREAEPVTWFEDIHLVPAGTVVRIDLADGATTQHRYWNFPAEGPEASGTDEEIVERYGELFAQSVAECATADTEIGLFLSGGIDSASVAALAARHTDSLHTFTVLSGATYRNGDAENGAFVADFLGLPNHQVLFDADRVPGIEEWKRLLWLSETPECGPEQFYKHELHRYAKAARPELRGMLLGAASDEFNGGYSPDLAGGGDWRDFEAHLRGMSRRGALLDVPALGAWWEQIPHPVLRDDAVHHHLGTTAKDPYAQYLLREWRKIQQYNCWHEDRTAAGSGVEARVPFLDHRLVELCASVPADRRGRLLWDKRILRAAVTGLLPQRIVEREKVPFFYGPGDVHTFRTFSRMLAQDGGALLEEALSTDEARRHLDADGLRTMVAHLSDAPSIDVQLVLRLVNLGLLARMAEDMPPPLVTTSAGPVPQSLTVSDWDAERVGVEERIGVAPSLAPGLVVGLAPEVLLLSAPGEDGIWFLAVNGTLEYVVDEEPWLSFLRAVDGRRPLGEILTDCGIELGAVRDDLVGAMEHGLLRESAA